MQQSERVEDWGRARTARSGTAGGFVAANFEWVVATYLRAFEEIRIGKNARNLVVTGEVECGRRHRDPGIHQDIVQALSGRNIVFRDFTSGNPATGRWICWGAGGGWYITWANGDTPTNLICNRCRLATYNQNLRIGESVRSGARNSVFGYHCSYGIFIKRAASQPVNVGNRVRHY